MNDDADSKNTAGEVPAEMVTVAVGSFDENGEWHNDSDRAAPAQVAENTAAAPDTSRPMRKHLPRTASSLALFELLSGLSIAGGFAVRQLRQRLS